MAEHKLDNADLELTSDLSSSTELQTEFKPEEESHFLQFEKKNKRWSCSWT